VNFEMWQQQFIDGEHEKVADQEQIAASV